jgi:protein involved in polysaccharide export with SLBB domain
MRGGTVKKRYKGYRNFTILFSLLIFLILSLQGQPVAQNRSIDQGKKEKKERNSIEKEYKIQPLDILSITIYMEDDLQKQYRVSQNGCISYPFIGEVRVAGLTVSEVEEKLTRLLSPDYFINPPITVFVEKYNSRMVFILGAITNPGSYAIPPEKELTVVEAVSLAGGFTEKAAVNKTKIIRVEDGQEKIMVVKITDVTKGGDKSKDIVLKPNDIIIVPESFF